MPMRYKVEFDYPISSRTKGHVVRAGTMSAEEADADVAHLRALGYTGIRVVPVQPSARARGHTRRIHTAAFDAEVEAIEAKSIESGRHVNPYAVATAQFEREGRPIFRRKGATPKRRGGY